MTLGTFLLTPVGAASRRGAQPPTRSRSAGTPRTRSAGWGDSGAVVRPVATSRRRAIPRVCSLRPGRRPQAGQNYCVNCAFDGCYAAFQKNDGILVEKGITTMTDSREFKFAGRHLSVRAAAFSEGWRVRVSEGDLPAADIVYTVTHEKTTDAPWPQCTS